MVISLECGHLCYHNDCHCGGIYTGLLAHTHHAGKKSNVFLSCMTRVMSMRVVSEEKWKAGAGTCSGLLAGTAPSGIHDSASLAWHFVHSLAHSLTHSLHTSSLTASITAPILTAPVLTASLLHCFTASLLYCFFVAMCN